MIGSTRDRTRFPWRNLLNGTCAIFNHFNGDVITDHAYSVFFAGLFQRAAQLAGFTRPISVCTV